MCFGWAESYGIPVLVANCANLIGKVSREVPSNCGAGRIERRDGYLFTDDFGWSPIEALHAHDVALALVYLLEHATQSKRYKIPRGDTG